MKPYCRLSLLQKNKLKIAVPLGLVEVSCPWWPENHWEPKLTTDFFEEAIYRIKKPKNKLKQSIDFEVNLDRMCL